MTRWLASPWLTIRVQLALGIFFVVAALPKIVDPPSFAHMMYNYRILPASLINIMAITMPWIELLCGLALIAGIWTGAARTIIAAMLLTFIVAISINLGRGNAIDCGCFDPNPRPKSRAERLDDMRFVIFRDLGMLAMVGQLWYASREQKKRLVAEPPAESIAA